MDRDASVLLVTEGGGPWPSLVGILAERFEYRVLSVRTPSEALALVEHAHVDLVLVEESDSSFSGCELLARLRTSHPDVLRMVVLAGASTAERDAVARASVYQFLRQPMDAEQASLVLKRGLEARELARRHRRLARELKIRRMVVLTADDECISTRHLSPEIQSIAPWRPAALAQGVGAANSTLKDRVETLERHAVREALARHRWNQSKAAAELGLSRVGLANKIKRYGLDRTDP